MSTQKSIRKLKINKCSDPMMWYRDKVGQLVDFIREERTIFWSREEAGFSNIVKKDDAEIVWVSSDVNFPITSGGGGSFVSVMVPMIGKPLDYEEPIMQIPLSIVSDEEIIELRRNTKIKDVTKPYSDTLDFAHSLINLINEKMK